VRKTAGYRLLVNKGNELMTEALQTAPTTEYLQQYRRN
jgi:hypothetical protein